MRNPVVAVLLAATVMQSGCGQFKPAPLVSRSEFPNALKGIERRSEGLIAALDANDPQAVGLSAERALQLANIAREHAATSGVDSGGAAALNRAIDSLITLFSELDTLELRDGFPAGFDSASTRQRLEARLADLRAALPADLASFLEREKRKRAASQSNVAGPAPSSGAAISPGRGPIAAVAARVSPAEPAPLCPSVMLWDNASREQAPSRINRVAELMRDAPRDRRWVQLVPTLHARLNEDLSIAQYGVMINRRESWQAADNFETASGGLADRLRDAFAGTIRQAARRGLHVAILPHLDPAGPIEEWRNGYRFAPTQKIDDGSYESLLIEPLADAIEAETTVAMRIDLALSGEMGRSLFEHPGEYLDLLLRLRKRFASNPRAAGVRIGVSLNWDGLAGEAVQSDSRAISRFFAACDFVGCSMYCPVEQSPTPRDFAQSVNDFRVRLRGIAGGTAADLPLTISEVGLGGGDTPRATPAQIAGRPWSGRGYPGFDPWQDASKSRLRRAYHKALCVYLGRGEVERAFLWSEGPWDPQGIADRRFRDDRIAATIRSHNRTDRP